MEYKVVEYSDPIELENYLLDGWFIQGTFIHAGKAVVIFQKTKNPPEVLPKS